MCESRGFEAASAEGVPSVESLVMLLRADPKTLSRTDAVAAAVGVELGKRLLDALSLRFCARAAGSEPTTGSVDEVAQELSAALDLHPATATAKTAAARRIVRRLPTSLKALERGRLTLRQVEKVELATRELSVTDAQAVEAAAVPGNPRRLNARLTRELARIAPDLVRKKTEQRHLTRKVDPWSDPFEGVAGLMVEGPMDQVALIKSGIDAQAQHRQPGECRALSARRFDVLLGWARAALGLDEPQGQARPQDPDAPAASVPEPRAAGSRARRGCGSCGRTGPARVPINVTVSAETLLRLSDAPGDLDGLPIPADIARALAADGNWRRWTLEPTGRLTDIGSHTYRPGAELDRYIRGRDRTCRFPTCTAPAERCDLDHTLAFHTEGGKTCDDNLTALCRHHHRLKHETDWTYTTKPNGDVLWTAPSGRTYTAPAEDHRDDPALTAYLTKRHEREEKKNRETVAAGRPEALGECPF